MRVEEIKAAIEELPGAESVYIRKCVVCKFWSARAGLDHRALAAMPGKLPTLRMPKGW